MERMEIRIKKLREGARAPAYGSLSASGADLYACVDSEVYIGPGQTVMIPSGIAIELPPGCAGLVCARSGVAVKKGLAPANKVGVIDPDYRGEVLVALHNHSGAIAEVAPGERIAQLLITPVLTASFVEAEFLSGTTRGDGGFGSTGLT